MWRSPEAWRKEWIEADDFVDLYEVVKDDIKNLSRYKKVSMKYKKNREYSRDQEPKSPPPKSYKKIRSKKKQRRAGSK